MDMQSSDLVESKLTAEVIEVSNLDDRLIDIWNAFRTSNPDLAHPYFDVRYTQACVDVPGAALAVLWRSGRIVGFFPMQTRLGVVQPLGAPMTDYHGVISPRGTAIHPRELAEALKATINVGAWSSSKPSGFIQRSRMAMNVSGGPNALQARLDAKNRKFWKNMRRKARRLDDEVGPVDFRWSDDDPATLEWIIKLKREQYARTRRHDIFACGWTAELLRSLRRSHDGEFGLRVASLRSQSGELMAAEAALDDGHTLHLWFPTYSEAFAKVGPGMHLTWMQMIHAAGEGYSLVDFGCGEGGYKENLADVVGHVWEGVAADGERATRSLGQILRQQGPAPLQRFGVSLSRRLDVINACETSPAGWVAGAAAAAQAMLFRQKEGAA